MAATFLPNQKLIQGSLELFRKRLVDPAKLLGKTLTGHQKTVAPEMYPKLKLTSQILTNYNLIYVVRYSK